MAATVQVEGLRDLVRSFTRTQKELGKELRAELKDVAAIVATEAQQIARQKGLVASGKLVRSIRPGVRGSIAVVRETAVRKPKPGARARLHARKGARSGSHDYSEGFPYPAVYEFGGRGEGKYGPRAFLLPALEAKADEAEKAVEELFDRLTSETGFGRGGTL